MKGIINRLAELFRREPPARPPSVRTTEGGLQVLRDGELLCSVQWTEVRKIIAYKYDLFGTDEICVGFLTDANADSWLEVSEEWEGFLVAIDKMAELFPSISRDWYNEIMVPAFARKETVLYEAKL